METYEIVRLKQEIAIREDLAPLKAESSYSIARWLQDEIGYDTQENLVILCLDTQDNVVCFSRVFKGSLNQTVAHPRELFQRALLSNTARFIIAHNHPSNDSRPSTTDDGFTLRIKECGEMLDIEMLDHIIVGQNTYYSYREQGVLI